MTINIHEAKTNFSKLLAQVISGEEVIIAKAGKPIAYLKPIVKKMKQRMPGSAKHKILISKNFNAPLPKYILDAFEK